MTGQKAMFMSNSKPDEFDSAFESTFETVRVKRLELVDSQGRVRAVLGIGEQDQPGLQLLRRNGNVALNLCTHVDHGEYADLEDNTHECSKIDFFDMEGVLRMRIQMGDEWPQYPGIALMNSKGEEMIGLVVTPNDDAEIGIQDGKGRPIWMETN